MANMKQLKAYAQKTLDGDEEAAGMLVMCAPSGTLGDKDPKVYAQEVIDGEHDPKKDEDGCDAVPVGDSYSDNEIPWSVEDDLRAFMKAQEIMGSAERYAKVTAAIEQRERQAAKAKAMLAGATPKAEGSETEMEYDEDAA